MYFYQIEVNRLLHVGTHQGDTVALIKDKALSIQFAQSYSMNPHHRSYIVRVSGHDLERYFKDGRECSPMGQFLKT